MLKKRSKLYESKPQLVVISAPHSLITEQFRKLRVNVGFLPSGQSTQSLVITSAATSGGESWIAANLAVLFAREGKKVLLIDSDMRKPSIHEMFRSSNDIGLSSVLGRQATIEAAIQKTFVEHLDLLSVGPIPDNPAELIASENMDHFMERTEKSYDIIIYNSPPVLSVVDAQLLSNKCDGSILVINSGKTGRLEAVKAKETIAASNGKLIGVILNNFSPSAVNSR